MAATTHPLSVIPRSIGIMITGRAGYPRERANITLTLEDGRAFRIFREVVMRHNPPTEGGGVFRVWFYAMTTPAQTRMMSLATTLFFYGMPGFRGKIWLEDATSGEFGGVYQFDTVAQANAYAESFAMALSARRARPGMFRKEVYAKHGETSLLRAQADPIRLDGGSLRADVTL